MSRWSLPRLHPVRRREELEDLLAAPRDTHPDPHALAVLIPTLQKTLDRPYSALEAADRKAAVLLGAILGIGVLNSDRLHRAPLPDEAPRRDGGPDPAIAADGFAARYGSQTCSPRVRRNSRRMLSIVGWVGSSSESWRSTLKTSVSLRTT